MKSICFCVSLLPPIPMGNFFIGFDYILFPSLAEYRGSAPVGSLSMTSLLFACSCISIDASKAGSRAMHYPYLEHAVPAVTFPFTDLCSMLARASVKDEIRVP